MRQLPLVERAMGRQALALLRQLDAAWQFADDNGSNRDLYVRVTFPRDDSALHSPGPRIRRFA